MKRLINKSICGLLAASVLSASCAKEFEEFSGDEVRVSFTLSPEGMTAGTRAGEPEADGKAHISDGTKADILIYAVYDKDNKLIAKYGTGSHVDGIEAGEGQTVIKVESFPTTVDFMLAKGKEYNIAFWAQSSKCKAYNTQNLARVEVLYSEVEQVDGETVTTSTPNNDELRDAFCKVKNITADRNADNECIWLYRPLAQVNIGTSGYDFENVTLDGASKKWRYSRIRLGDIARYLNVVEDRVLSSTTSGSDDSSEMTPEARTTVDYGYAPIPAYVNMPQESVPSIEPSEIQDGEEFLKVDLNGDKQFEPYKGYKVYEKYKNADDETKQEQLYTEEFKYLSMCYVLVNSKNDESAVLDNVSLWVATDKSGKDEMQLVDIGSVPVRRNWRTNIISQNLFTAEVDLLVDIRPIYSGDYNTEDLEQWDGPLADGAYYDAESDEILISNINGMIWLARMVNGKYSYPVNTYDPLTGTVGNTVFSDSGIEDPTTTEGKPGDPYEGMSKEQRTMLKKRIMRATHQEWNSNTGGTIASGGAKWPAKNNFHFMHSSQSSANSRVPNDVFPAKVRLTADIDMSGIEWIPIGFAQNTREVSDVFTETDQRFVGFCGEFEGGHHAISNLRNKRFTANVHDNALQYNNFTLDGQNVSSGSAGPYSEAVQWFGVGLFGQIAQSAAVRNLRLTNIDIFGYTAAGAIAGIATGADAYVENCYVDGGSITLSPMYRGDAYRTNPLPTQKGRTFARGIYAGGIIGYCNIGRRGTADKVWTIDDKYGSVINCDVRNLTIRGYRQIGGIIGGFDIHDKSSVSNGSVTVGGSSRMANYIKDNKVSNVLIIADKFQPYDIFFNMVEEGNYKNGFGWQLQQLAWAGEILGGVPSRQQEDPNGAMQNVLNPDRFINNTFDNVTITEFATSVTAKTDSERKAYIQQIPLNLMPMLSSFYSDKVTLKSNFSGPHSACKRYNTHPFAIESRGSGYLYGDKTYELPYKLPYDLSIDWKTDSGNVGVYVESIVLEGKDGESDHDHTVITADDLKNEGDCVMYIASRDRKEFVSEDPKVKNDGTGTFITKVSDIALRGNPYAYTGLCLAPNPYTQTITLNDISIYDVYKAVELDGGEDVDPGKTTLNVNDSNLRGYMDCGKGWKAMNFTRTTFDKGAQTGHGEAEHSYTFEVEQTENGTVFTDCWFKAPYIINIAEDAKVVFENTYATSATGYNEKISMPEGCRQILINDDGLGNVTVTYLPTE